MKKNLNLEAINQLENTPLNIQKAGGNNKVAELEKQNKELKQKIAELERQLNEEKNKNKDLERQIKEKNLKLEEAKKLSGPKVSSSKNDNPNEKRVLELVDKLCEQEKEIKELKQIKSIIPFNILPGEKLMSVIFISVDQKIHYSLICKTNDDFTRVEKALYNKFPEYLKTENTFTIRNNKVNRFQRMDENKIGDGDIIMLRKSS